MARSDVRWEIMKYKGSSFCIWQVCFVKCLNNVYEFCSFNILPKTLTVFLSNEGVSFQN
jgi:hypothetical protein